MTILIETERCIIKAPTLADLNRWSTLLCETKEAIQMNLDHSIQHYKKYGFSVGSVFIKENNQFIGKAGLFYYISTMGIQHDVEMSCILQKEYWNKGYATEISKKLIAWGFSKLYMNKLTALTRPDNLKSQYVLEKTGMKYVRNIQAEDGDFLLYEITWDSSDPLESTLESTCQVFQIRAEYLRN